MGFTVIEKRTGVPKQVLENPLTVKMLVIGMLDKLAAVKEAIFPVPVTAINPTAVFVCVHLYSVPDTVEPPNKMGEVIKLVHNA